MSTQQSKGQPERSSRSQWSNPASSEELSLREVLDKYCSDDNQDLLKHVLMAKAEEDKRQTAQELLKTEQARIYSKQLDMELIKEQSKINQSGTTFPYYPQVIQPQLYQYQPLFPQHHYYYSHAPVQQHVIARITHASSTSPVDAPPLPTATNYAQQPATSTTNYSSHPYYHPIPESTTANPSMTDTDKITSSAYPPDTNSRHHQQTINRTPTPPSSQQPTTPISPTISKNDCEPSQKRYYTSISAINNTPDTPTPTSTSTTIAKISHDKVMEALKAKISQRGAAAAAAKKGNNSNNTTPTATAMSTPISTTNTTSTAAPSAFHRHQHIDKRQRTLPKPYISTSTIPPPPQFEVPRIITYPEYPQHPHSTTSPRSVHKPILPPIDTSMGRIQPPTTPTSKDYHPHHHLAHHHSDQHHQQHPSSLSPIQTPRTNSSSSASSHSDSISTATTTSHTTTTTTAIAAAAIATMTVHPTDG